MGRKARSNRNAATRKALAHTRRAHRQGRAPAPRPAVRAHSGAGAQSSAAGAAATGGQPSLAGWGDDLVTSVLGTLIVLGLFLDGWAHINLLDNALGTFFTPWHAVLYTGFSAAAAWILTRNQRRGRWRAAAVPAGYMPALWGILLSPVALVGDAVWHTIFGVEEGCARLLAPFHLVLFLGAALVVTAPLRSELARRRPPQAPGFLAFLPALISLAAVTAMVTFFFQWISPVVNFYRPLPSSLTRVHEVGELVEVNAISSLLITNALLMGPVVFLLRRWRPPFGSVTFLFGTVVVLDAALSELVHAPAVLGAVLGGLVADLLVTRLRASPTSEQAVRTVAGATPLAMWLSYFLAIRVLSGSTWQLELWLGATVLAAMTGFILAVVMAPAPVPIGDPGGEPVDLHRRSPLPPLERRTPVPLPDGRATLLPHPLPPS